MVDEVPAIKAHLFFEHVREKLGLWKARMMYVYPVEFPDYDVEGHCHRPDVITVAVAEGGAPDKVYATIIHEIIHLKHPELTEEEAWRRTEEVYRQLYREREPWPLPSPTPRTFEGAVPIEEAA